MIVTDALVLARSDYRDYDRMVTLLTPALGRVDAAARGCKKARSPLMNAAECFCAGEYTLVETKGRYAVTQCQITESFYPLRADLEKLTAGAYYLYLAGQAAQPGQAAPALFMTTLRALAFLSYSDLPPALVTMAYELHYLHLLGQAPRADACVRCGRPFGEEKTRFDPRQGGACHTDCPGSAGKILSNGARRILMRVPLTRFDVIDKLEGRPEWPEAARRAREFIAYTLDAPPRAWPNLPPEE